VHDVERALRERLPEVRLHTDWHAELRTARDGNRRADGDHVGLLAPQQRAPSGEQIGGARRRCDHRHFVTKRTQSARNPRDVLVDVVRLRPRKRRHQADPHRAEA
jgi:hypothetical protein